MTPHLATPFRVTLLLVTSFVVSCGGDRSRSPTCGLALLVGPRMIQQQLAILPFVLTDAPRGLSASLPALVAGTSHQGEVSVAYEGPRLALTYQGPSFPPFPTSPCGPRPRSRSSAPCGEEGGGPTRPSRCTASAWTGRA